MEPPPSAAGATLATTILWAALSFAGSEASLALGASEFTSSFPDRFSDYTEARVFLNLTDPATGESRPARILDGKYGSGLVAPARGYLRRPVSPEACEVAAWRHVAARQRVEAAAAGPDYQPVPWVALVRRSKCDFRKKVEAAFRVNASAVIVYNHVDGEEPLVMDLRAGSLKHGYLFAAAFGNRIPAVFVKKEDGEKWRDWLDNGTTIWVDIIPGNYMSPHYKNINRTSILFVSVSFIVLMIVSLAWLIFYYVQRFRYIHAKDRLAKRLCCAAKKALSNIPIRHLKPADKEVQEEGEYCAICIEAFRVADAVRVLPCKHEFHKVCVDQWLLDQRTCPMCKMDILKYYGLLTESQESIIQIDTDDLVSTPPSDIGVALRGFPFGSSDNGASHIFSRCGISISACVGGGGGGAASGASNSPARSVANASRPGSSASNRAHVLVRTLHHRSPSSSGAVDDDPARTTEGRHESPPNRASSRLLEAPTDAGGVIDCRDFEQPSENICVATVDVTSDVDSLPTAVHRTDGDDDGEAEAGKGAVDRRPPSSRPSPCVISENPLEMLIHRHDHEEADVGVNVDEEEEEEQKEDSTLLPSPSPPVPKLDADEVVDDVPADERDELNNSDGVRNVDSARNGNGSSAGAPAETDDEIA